MTIRQAGKGVVTTGGGVYNIGFNGGDETQLTAYSMRDLEELWRSLCPEFGCTVDSVDYVERA